MSSGAAKLVVWPLLAAGSAAATYWCWQLPPRRVALEVLPVSGDQVRITWNGASAAALLAPSGAIEIQDGADLHRVRLSGEQVRRGRLVYRRETGDVRVRLTMDPGERWARLTPESDFARFRTSAPATEPVRSANLVAAVHSAPIVPAKALKGEADAEPARKEANRVIVPRRPAVIPGSPAVTQPPGDPLLTVPAPALAIPRPAVSASAFAMALPPGVVPTPRQPAYSGPRSGRIIWTGAIKRRGVVEIEGAHPSIGSIIGGLPGVPVTVRVSPAGFSSRGLVVYTADISSDGRVETGSASNGWNATLFRWEPDRARELVVLEAPNPSNDFKRLAVRNDARTCDVVLVEWSVR